MPSSVFDQARYQVRFEWGADGLARLAPADVVVIVDVLGASTTVTDAAARGERVPLEGAPHGVSDVAAQAAASGALVMLGGLRNASAVATAILGEQQRRGDRAHVAVIACGDAGDGAPLRFAVEDQLGAGAVIDALAARGIDHSSPEAAATGEAFRGLRAAVRHLLTASGSGQDMIERGLRDEVLAAAQIDAVAVVPVLREGIFATV